MRLVDLGFKALFVDAQALPFLKEKGLIKAIDEFGLQGRIYSFGENNELNRMVEKSGGAILPAPGVSSNKEDLTFGLRHGQEATPELSKLTGIESSLLRKHALHIKCTDKKVLTDMPSLYGYSFAEYKVKKDCFLRLIAHGFENCIHGCTYCYANYTSNRPTTLLINSSEVLKINIADSPFKKLIYQGFVVNIGSVTDLCSEVSLYFGILQDFLRVLRAINTVLVTKCPSFTRDEIIECIKKHSKVKVTFTFTNLPEFELNLPYDSRYFPTREIRKAISAGVDVSLLYRPIIPGKNDDEKQILSTLQEAKRTGIKNIGMGFIRINERMYKSISSASPVQGRYMLGQVSEKFDDDLYPALEYRLRMAKMFRGYCDKLNLNLSFCQGYLGAAKDSYTDCYCLCQKERWLS